MVSLTFGRMLRLFVRNISVAVARANGRREDHSWRAATLIIHARSRARPATTGVRSRCGIGFCLSNCTAACFGLPQRSPRVLLGVENLPGESATPCEDQDAFHGTTLALFRPESTTQGNQDSGGRGN